MPLRHGLTDQEAPQAHAQEEAQEAAEEDPLATSSAGQVSSDRPVRGGRFASGRSSRAFSPSGGARRLPSGGNRAGPPDPVAQADAGVVRGVVARGRLVEPDRERGAAAAEQRGPPGCGFELGTELAAAAARRVRRPVPDRSRTAPDSSRARRSRALDCGPPSASHAWYTAGVSQPKCGAAITRSSGGSPAIGSRRSPRPRIQAGSCCRQNGTSEPSAAASVGVAAELPQDRGGIGRPAAEPGAGGDPFVDDDRPRCADRRRGRARDEVRRVRRHVGRERAGHFDVGRAGIGEEQLVVGRGHGDRERLEVVVAVGARAEHPERQRHLGVGGDARHPAALATAAQSGRSNVSARRLGSMPAASRTDSA